MSQEICKCSLSDDTCPDCLAQDNEALLDHQNELMERVLRAETKEVGDEMKLQRYFSEIAYDNDGQAEGTYAVADNNGIFVLADAHEARIEELEKRNAELESALCETCKDPSCEDSRLAYYVTKAIKAGERIGRLEMALADIAEGDCTCFEDDSCAVCIAKKELRGGV
jgi:hypothetical protein